MTRLLTAKEVESIRRKMAREITAYRRVLERKLKELEDGLTEADFGDE